LGRHCINLRTIRFGKHGAEAGRGQVLPPDTLREHEKRQIARALSQKDLDDITQLWLTGTLAGDEGDIEARAFFSGTFGPWASEIMRRRAS